MTDEESDTIKTLGPGCGSPSLDRILETSDDDFGVIMQQCHAVSHGTGHGDEPPHQQRIQYHQDGRRQPSPSRIETYTGRTSSRMTGPVTSAARVVAYRTTHLRRRTHPGRGAGGAE